MIKQSKLFTIVGPSGVGKSFLMERLQQQYPESFVVAKLLTTRPPRPGETALDRQFVSEEKYLAMRANEEFIWSDSFYDNHYGYTHEAVRPNDKHILINALPPMTALFSAFPDVVIIGLTIAPENCELIKQRLETRGDPSSAIRKRLATLREDIKIMRDNRAFIERHGKLFEISDNTSLETVLEWLRYKYL